MSPKEFIDVMQKRKDGVFNAVCDISITCLLRNLIGDVEYYSQRRDTGAFELITRIKHCVEECMY